LNKGKDMRLVFFINTPAQVHTWRNVIDILVNKGHHVRVLARDYGSTLTLLDKYGFEYSVYIKPSRARYLKGFEFLSHVLGADRLSREFKPDIIVGFGVVESLTSALLRKPCILVIDSEPLPVQHFLSKLFASVILTPSCFRKELGKKQIRFNGYKELAYLHPDSFKPDPSIYDELGINRDEKYVILRFNAFDAFHDIGKYGFPLHHQHQLVKELERHARVFISAEGSLPEDLKSYNLSIPFHRIHHVLYYAQLLVSDTQTLTTEAAILGTPAIRCNSFAGPNDMGNFVELEQKYDLIYCFPEPDRAIEKALELVQKPDLKERWAEKREILLGDKIDVAGFMVWFIENYPESLEQYRRSQVWTRSR